MSLWILDPKELWFPYKNEMDSDRVAIGGDLHWVRVLKGFEKGCYLNYGRDEDIQWYSPEERAVILPHLKEEDPLEFLQEGWTFHWDIAFQEVMHECARPDEEKQWLHSEVQQVYALLFEKGFAHSLVAEHHGKRVGGLMGVAIGRAFFGMSMYHAEPNASKYALRYLIQFLKNKKWKLLDVQKLTPFLAQMGAQEWPRDKFLDELREQLKFRSVRGDWSEERNWKMKEPYPLSNEWPSNFNRQDPCPFLV